jgi:peptidoglycan/xylan/chitin deacetylase (PgdA/CDA1 family)
MDWKGHSFAFILRVDIEHVEAQRYLGDFRLCKVSVINLLDQLAELGTRHSFAVLGITAEMYPDLMKDIAATQELYGHGMYHEPALAGQPLERQRHEMRRMYDAIADACGVKIRGLACPHHGLADDNTLLAAAEVGIEYVQSKIRAENNKLPQWYQIPGSSHKILIPGAQGRGASDYTDRRIDWAAIHEEAFSPAGARKKWMAMIDWAKQNNTMCSLVVHPWMLVANPGEVQVVKDIVRYARDQGGWLGTFDQVADLAKAQA